MGQGFSPLIIEGASRRGNLRTLRRFAGCRELSHRRQNNCCSHSHSQKQALAARQRDRSFRIRQVYPPNSIEGGEAHPA